MHVSNTDAAGRLNASAGRFTGSELTGNCRLSWYDRLLRRPLNGPAEAELFTRQLHKAALGNQEGLARLLAIAAEKMDLPKREAPTFAKVTSPEQALEIVKSTLIETQTTFAARWRR